MTLKVFALSHTQDRLDALPKIGWLEPVHLGRLSDLPTEFQDNGLGECRAFLSDSLDSEKADWIGCLNARYDAKYAHMTGVRLAELPAALERLLAPSKVVAVWPTNASWLDCGSAWADFSARQHPGLLPLLEELAAFTDTALDTGRPSLWGHDFVCARAVWKDWRVFFRKCFAYFYDRYGMDLPFPPINIDPKRKAAYFYERVTTLYFANRKDLEIVPLQRQSKKGAVV
jgi:hypothetical protein